MAVGMAQKQSLLLQEGVLGPELLHHPAKPWMLLQAGAVLWEWPWRVALTHSCSILGAAAQHRHRGPQMCWEQGWQRLVITWGTEVTQREMQWLTGDTLGMEMTLETRLSFTKPCTYRPSLSPELAVLNGVNWPKRSTLGADVGRGGIDDTFARRNWGNLFAHTFCTTLKQNVSLHERVPLKTEHMQDIQTTAQALMAVKRGLSPGASSWWQQRETKLCPGMLQDILCYQDWAPPLAKRHNVLHLVSFSHCSALMLSQHVNSAQEMLVRMPGECFHHKWLIRLKYCAFVLGNKGPSQRQSTKTLKRQGGGKGIYQQSWQKLVMLWALSHTFIPF